MICNAEVSAPPPSLATNHSTMPPGRMPSSGIEPFSMKGSTVGNVILEREYPEMPAKLLDLRSNFITREIQMS